MAEPRKVQFVTLSAFAAGSATDSRKQRRLEEDDEGDEEEAEDDVNFDEEDSEEEEEEVDDDDEATAAATAGAGGVVVGNNGRLDLRGDNNNKAEGKKITMRLNLSLCEPSDHASAEFNYGELVKHIQKKNNPPLQKNPPIQNPGLNSSDPFNDDERERLQVEALAKKFEDKYSNTSGKKKKDRMQDLVDIGFGYDETDPFIDNSEAYDELVPASLTTKLGGFYINTGTLQFRPASDTEGDEGTKIVIDDDDDDEVVIKRRKKKEVNSLEEKKPRKIRVPKQGVLPLNLHRPEKKKRKKLMKDSLCLAAMLRRFTREKEEMRKRNPNALLQTGLANNNPHSGVTSTNLLASNSSHHLLSNVANSDVSLADLTSDPAMVSLLGTASEKELQDLLGDLDFSLLDSAAPQHVMATARENGLLGVGVPANKAAGGGQARGLGASGGHFSPPPLPDGVPAPLIKRIEDLRTASRQFDQEGRKKFFTLDMNNILLDIELQVQEQPQEVRSGIYSHLEAFVPCNKEALLKRLKKLSINIQDDRLRTPLLKLKLAVCSVMPEQIARYNMDCIAKAAKQQSEEGEKNGSEEEDEEKPGKRVMGPRKKFVWDDKLRSLLCSLVRVKLSCYEMENQCSLTVEEYLKAFMENEVKPLWPKGWMQARILLKESRVVHCHLTGNLVKRRMVPGPKAKAKDGPWIQRPPLTMATAMGTSMPHMPAGQRPPSSPSEPICLSDSLDEDLTAPSLDSVSHALALFGGGSSSKGIMGHSDSPLSPPPLQMPTSSPPSVTPHYSSSSATQLSASVTSSAQHSLSKTETVPLAGMPTTTPPSAVSTSSPSASSSTPSTSASMARLQMAGSSLSLSLASRSLDVTYGLIKGSSAASQNQRHVTMVTPGTHRPGSAMGGGSNKLHPLPSPSPPKQRPPPTSSPLLPPHQKGFGLGSPGVGAAASSNNPHALAKNSSAKASSVSSNGGAMSCGVPTSSSSSSRSNNNSHGCLRTFSPVVAFSTSHSPQGKSHALPSQQQQQHQTPTQHHHHQHLHQANFITPMQATLTKSSHSSNASPIIKLTPRPPAPTPPPSSSSPSPSSSPSNSLSHQYSSSSAKSPGFRPPFSGGQGAKQQGQGNYGFAGGQKAQSAATGGVNNGGGSINHGSTGGVVVSSRQELTPSPSPSSSLVSANHGQRQRGAAGGGAGQGSNKAGGGRASSGTPSATSHLSQVSSAGSALLGSPAALPLSFGMLGGLVPVTLPFQFPSLLNFTPPGTPGAGSMGTAASANSGYSLSPNELMDLYKSLQSGAQAALPPHLQLAFSDANQSQGGDMKRKSH